MISTMNTVVTIHRIEVKEAKHSSGQDQVLVRAKLEVNIDEDLLEKMPGKEAEALRGLIALASKAEESAEGGGHTYKLGLKRSFEQHTYLFTADGRDVAFGAEVVLMPQARVVGDDAFLVWTVSGWLDAKDLPKLGALVKLDGVFLTTKGIQGDLFDAEPEPEAQPPRKRKPASPEVTAPM